MVLSAWRRCTYPHQAYCSHWLCWKVLTESGSLWKQIIPGSRAVLSRRKRWSLRSSRDAASKQRTWWSRSITLNRAWEIFAFKVFTLLSQKRCFFYNATECTCTTRTHTHTHYHSYSASSSNLTSEATRSSGSGSSTYASTPIQKFLRSTMSSSTYASTPLQKLLQSTMSSRTSSSSRSDSRSRTQTQTPRITYNNG